MTFSEWTAAELLRKLEKEMDNIRPDDFALDQLKMEVRRRLDMFDKLQKRSELNRVPIMELVHKMLDRQYLPLAVDADAEEILKQLTMRDDCWLAYLDGKRYSR